MVWVRAHLSINCTLAVKSIWCVVVTVAWTTQVHHIKCQKTMRYTEYFKKEDVSRSEWDEIKRARERKRQITHSSLTKHPQHSQSEFLYSFPHNRVAQVRRRLFIFDFHSIVSRLYIFLGMEFLSCGKWIHFANGEKTPSIHTHTTVRDKHKIVKLHLKTLNCVI